MNIAAKDVAKVDTTLEASLKKVNGKVSYEITCDVFGYGGKEEETFSTTEIKTPYEKFQKNFVPSPYVALLQHYSSLDNRIPLPGKDVPSKIAELTEAYRRIFKLQSRVVSLTMKHAQSLAAKVNASYEALDAINVDAKDWKDKLTQWSNQVTLYQDEYWQWTLRSTLIADATKLNDPPLQTKYAPCLPYHAITNKQNSTWFESGHQNIWARGIMPESGHAFYSKIAGDIQKTEDAHWSLDYNMFNAGEKKYTVTKHDRIIIGYMVISHWEDGSNGWWQLLSGGVNTSEVAVEFSRRGSRGTNWSLWTWSVDKALYERSY